MTEIETQPVPKVLKGKELDAAYSDLRAARGIEPDVLDAFLHVDTTHIGLSRFDKYIPPTLLVAHIATLGALNYYGQRIPAMTMLPAQLDALLQAVHNMGSNAANSPALRDHLPYLLLEASALWGTIKTIPNLLRLRSKRGNIQQVQADTKMKQESGELSFSMAKGHSACFVGRGDRTATLLQDMKPADKVMLYAHAQIDSSIYQKIRDHTTQQALFEIFDRGDFKTAGEVVLFPVKDEDMFLPSVEDGHDMTLDEIEAVVNLCDDYCKARGIPPKRVVIVGRSQMKEKYATRSSGSRVTYETVTLQDLAEKMGTSRNEAQTEIFDPTELIIKEIIRQSGGKKILFVATDESDQRYGKRFYEALREFGYNPTSTDTIQVRYNIKDTPTETHANPDDISIILDPSRKESILARLSLASRAQQVIVVPEIIQAELVRRVEESSLDK